MSIKKSSATHKQQELENLRWNFKQYIVDNKLMKDLPKLVVDQIHAVSHNLAQCDFKSATIQNLEGIIASEEHVKNIVLEETKFPHWNNDKRKLGFKEIEYFKKEFSISLLENNIVEYTFSREMTGRRDISSILITAFPQYYYVQFEIMSQAVGIPELLEEEELIKLLQKEFQ